MIELTNWRFLPTPGGPDAPRDPACRVLAVQDLDPVDRAQIVASVGRGSQLAFTVDDLFAAGFAGRGGDASWIARSLETPLESWDAAGLRIWLYSADAGLVFAAGTTRVLAQAIQFGSAWEVFDPALDRHALGDAHRRAAAAHRGSLLRHYYPIDD